MQSTAPVSFDIQLERNEACAPPAVKQRLETQQRNPLTREMLQEKLDRAYVRKVQAMQSQVEQMRECSDRVGLTQERKSSLERAMGQKIIEELGQKHATAEAKRQTQLTEIQERARTHNNKVLLIRQRRDSEERAKEERVSELIVHKQISAVERQVQLLSEIQTRAKVHNDKAVARAKAKQENEQMALDTKKFQIEEKLTRAAVKRTDPAEKARAYNAKVQERLENLVSGHQQVADSRKARIETKLTEAATRREEVMSQVKAVAAQSAAPRVSSQQ